MFLRTLSTRGSALLTVPRPAFGLAMSTSGPNGLVMDCNPPGFMIPAGSRAFLILVSTCAPVSPRSWVRNGALRRPTPWWWVMVPPASVQAFAACCQAARYVVSASWSSAAPIRKVKYSDEPDGYRWDRWQATAWACADRAALMLW